MKRYTTKEAREILGVTEPSLKNALRVKCYKKKETQAYKPELGNPGSGNLLFLTPTDLTKLSRYFKAIAEFKAAKADLS